MSHYVCRYCGGPATWYQTHCWKCAPIARDDIKRDAKEAADACSRVFREALDSARK